MTRDEALKSMTIWPAFAAFQEQTMGSLTPGKLADFVVLDRDIMVVPESANTRHHRARDLYWRTGRLRAQPLGARCHSQAVSYGSPDRGARPAGARRGAATLAGCPLTVSRVSGRFCLACRSSSVSWFTSFTRSARRTSPSRFS